LQLYLQPMQKNKAVTYCITIDYSLTERRERVSNFSQNYLTTKTYLTVK
jgi:hypothetical protein